MDAAGNSGEYLGNQKERCRAGDLPSVFAAEKEAVEEHAQLWNSDVRTRRTAAHASAAGGADAASSTRNAETCDRVSGHEMTGAEGKLHRGMVRTAKRRELNAWKKVKVSQTQKGRALCKSVVDARWTPTWKMVDGKEDVKARLVSNGYQGPDPWDGHAGPPDA